ncbi:U-box domain-containing protein 24 [Ricinus communis]|uniref:U-box domain-containing protein 24 n=1 Tax=Ricinus communis TaxID=3988 RepID=UPI00077253C3|nr:U-box domain-containing protein 24 [Ricinus communis]XP_025013880.1 U-box domain-containing protein 24 [Ricinus communis]|eukprot:XP_015577365.1 U-box domain-containing protein 44 [Ricinus communis]
MVLDVLAGASSVPAAEFLSQVVEGMIEITYAANNVLIKKENFKELTIYMDRIIPILKELNKKDMGHSEGLSKAIEILNREVKAAKQLTVDCTKRNKVYLLMNCRTIAKNLEDITREMSRALDILPLASLGLSSGIIEEVVKLSDSMQRAEFRAAKTEEEILEKIETAIQERNVDRSYANNLVASIAEAVGISTDRATIKKEVEEFKSEIENTQLRKNQAEAIQMAQIIALLERADAASSPKEKEMKHFTKRKCLGSQLLEPLRSFYCPITQDVMVNPVETSSGQTFERSAIEKWLADGNNICPLTMTPIDTSVLRPNRTLRQSIEEWKDRNTMITITSLKSKLMSEEEEEVLQCLGQLEDLCEQRDQHREWVLLENYIPILIQLLGARNRDIRNHALVILCILAKDSDDAKERIAKVDNAIESIVKSLGRRIGERKLAVVLLIELSKCTLVKDCIGKVQGCILLLVTMSSSDDSQAAKDAQELLENLSYSDKNIILMAKANYFKHLLQRLCTGPDDVKMAMATTLADMELTDHNKASLFEGGVLGPLLQLVSDGDDGMKMVAIKAVRNISSLPANGLQMIREGAARPLLDLLFRHITPSSGLREQVSATIMHLAESTVSQGSSRAPISLLESDKDTLTLFSLINFTGPDVQQNILRIFYALCQSPSASNIKTRLNEYRAMQVLVQLCEHENLNVRPNAIKLLCCLVEDGDEAAILEHVDHKCLTTLLRIIQSSNDVEEIASAMGIIANFPENPQITQLLLDAGALQKIVKFLPNSMQYDPHKNQLVENAVGALCRFTVPAKLEWQKRAAEAGIIPLLVQLLDVGTALTRKYAAISLTHFSESSPRLSRAISKHKGFWCISAPQETGCMVHGGLCDVQSSFCLVEADAIVPLVRVLEDPDSGVREASLDALLTLIEAERLQSGSKLLSEANAIPSIIKLLCSSSPTLQEKALNALERIFRLPEFKQKYGPSAQMPLVDLTQRGNGSMKSLSARILAHLNLLHDQSSYF